MREQQHLGGAVAKGLWGIALVLALGQSGHGADLSAGKAKAKSACQTCHGLDGKATMPHVPHLKGQNGFYLAMQLRAYRSGQRHNEMMAVVSQGLSDSDIENLAAYYESLDQVCLP